MPLFRQLDIKKIKISRVIQSKCMHVYDKAFIIGFLFHEK